MERGVITDEKLRELRKWAEWGVEVSNRSRKRATTIEPGSTHIAVAGIDRPTDELELLDGLMRLRAVSEPPGAVHLAGKGLHGDGHYLAIARHMQHVTGEVAFFEQPEHAMDSALRHQLSWHLVAMLKLRGHQVFCPASSSIPWDLVAGVDDRTVEFQLLDDKPARIALRPPTTVTADDAAWINTHYMAALELRGQQVSRRFGLAFNLAYAWNLTDDYRVALTLLWAALEALFGDQRDAPVTARLAARIAAWCPTVTDSEVRALYSVRCDAVHGRNLTPQAAQQAMTDTERLLRNAMVRAIELKRAPLADW